MKFVLNKSTKILITIMIAISIIAILIAWIYYSGINNSEDPRVIEAKTKYEHYQKYISENNTEAVLAVLDSIILIYNQFDDYKNSFEPAVTYNNFAAVYLTKALYHTAIEEVKDSLLNIAKNYTEKSIRLYQKWITEFNDLEEEAIKNKVDEIYKNSSINNHHYIDKIKQKRIEDLIEAQKETPRRLSVSYTNLGIIMRHKYMQDSALVCYQKALELWDGNKTAKNNLNVLLNKPVEKENPIKKLFPNEK